MSYSHTINGSTSSALRRHIVPIGLGTTAAALAFNALGIYGDGGTGAHHSTGEFLSVCAVIVVAAGVVFGLVVPRLLERTTGVPALVLSIVAALLVVPAFWSGLPAVLGVGGAMLGWAGRDADRGHGKSQAAFVIGLLAIVGYVAVYLLDWMSTNGVL